MIPERMRVTKRQCIIYSYLRLCHHIFPTPNPNFSYFTCTWVVPTSKPQKECHMRQIYGCCKLIGIILYVRLYITLSLCLFLLWSTLSKVNHFKFYKMPKKKSWGGMITFLIPPWHPDLQVSFHVLFFTSIYNVSPCHCVIVLLKKFLTQFVWDPSPQNHSTFVSWYIAASAIAASKYRLKTAPSIFIAVFSR